MKKTLVLLTTAILCATMAQAATYVWAPQGGSTEWNNSANWVMDGTVMTENAPLVRGKNLWGTVTIDGAYTVATGTGYETEGWASHIQALNGANVTITNFTKFQHTNLTVGADSYLSISNNSGNVDFNSDENGYVWNIEGTLALGSLNWTSTTYSVALNLGSTGTLQMSNNALGAFNISATLGDLTEGSIQIEERLLISGINSLGGKAINIADGTETSDIQAEALTAENVGKYQVVAKTDGIYVAYITGSVPEPATASLSLLGLATLMMRRRRA